jgi:nanoRNase/pAp phosphatase (c-di-AMP/oligoRNAs hydrolase)
MPTGKWDISIAHRKLEELAHVLAPATKHEILILLHNNPDPDCIAAGFALSFLLSKRFGVKSVMGYGGVVARAENKAMVQRLRIKLTKLESLNRSDYYAVALVDSQPGTGNNLAGKKGEPPLIVIDHHPLRRASLKSPFHDVRRGYGATSTMLTEYLAAADLEPTRGLANALLYGIKTDTNSLLREAFKSDVAAFGFLSPMTNPRVIGLIERPKLPKRYFQEFHRGLSRALVCREAAVCYLGALASDSIVPELADTLLRIERVRWSLVLGYIGDTALISLRSSARKLSAGKVMRKLCAGRGTGGGHGMTAGGQIPLAGGSEDEADRTAEDLIHRFFGLIGRPAAHLKSLTETPLASACED